MRAAHGLPLREHRLQIGGTPKQLASLTALHVSRQEAPWRLWLRLSVGTLLAAWCVHGAVRALRQLPVLGTWGWLRQRAERLPRGLRWALLGSSLAAGLLLPWVSLRVGALVAYGALALLQPMGSLYLAVAALPLAPNMVLLGIGAFSVTEITLLVATASVAWNALLRPGREVRGALLRGWAAIRWADVAVVCLVLLALAGSLSAEYRKEALRELRVVVVESALLYALVRMQGYGTRRRLLDVYCLAAMGVAVFALARYPSPDGVIVAEGVRRARAFYGSPNNLALVLERLLPVGLAVLLWGRSRWRRYLYGLGAGVLGIAVVLTLSRGALLLGLPAALLVLALRGGRKATWLLLGGVAAGLALGVTLLGVERLSALADPRQGTALLRVSLWRSACAMIRDRPWLGVGPDNFLYYYGDYILPGAEVDRWLSHPHNLLLDSWVRLGIGGVLLVMVLVGGFVREALRLRRLLTRDAEAMAVGMIAGMAAAVAHGMADAFYFVPELAMWFMFALGWVMGGVRAPGEVPAGSPPVPVPGENAGVSSQMIMSLEGDRSVK